jgi:hypothetical protein
VLRLDDTHLGGPVGQLARQHLDDGPNADIAHG